MPSDYDCRDEYVTPPDQREALAYKIPAKAKEFPVAETQNNEATTATTQAQEENSSSHPAKHGGIQRQETGHAQSSTESQSA